MSQTELRNKLYHIIFGTESRAGKLFDVVLIYLIVISVAALIVDSMVPAHSQLRRVLTITEWVFTLLFTAEYVVRIYCSPRPLAYMRSFYGIIDLFSILPTYLGLIFPVANYALVVRLLRVLRIFRVLKLARYVSEANVLVRSLMAARRKILVFFFVVLVLATIFGSFMYVVEGPQNGFTSIPKSVYWTIVTITTVGYGDTTPATALGQVVATLAMLTGYSIIAIPTGIVTAELAQEIHRERIGRVCNNCGRAGHDQDARYCKHCGSPFTDKNN
jgi:voltage-gated potassium channel